MAEFVTSDHVDTFNDLHELGINDFDDDQLENTFTKATKRVQTIASKLDNKILLSLYSYYKQATEGPCNVSKPSWYDMKAKSKWEAWNSLGNMSKQEAKDLYIQNVKKVDPEFEESGKKTDPKEYWISVSIMQSADEELSNDEKTLVDYVKEGNCETVSSILSRYDNVSLEKVLNGLDEQGLNLAHWAADRGFADVLKVLLKFGLNVNITDVENQTALHYAVSCGHFECAELLLANGAKVGIKDNDGVDALSLASDDKMKKLLSK